MDCLVGLPRVRQRGLKTLMSLALTMLAGMPGAFLVSAPIAASAPGDPDPTFGANGTATIDFGRADSASALVAQPDGKLVLAGTTGTITLDDDGQRQLADADFALARLTPDGTPDATFGQGGRVTTDFGDADENASIWALALQPDGKLVAAGIVFRRAQDGNADPFVPELAFARYNPDGSLDATFGEGGKTTAALASPSGRFIMFAHPVGFGLQPAGGLVVASRMFEVTAWTHSALQRFDGSGAPDRSFGEGGRVLLDNWDAADLAVQADGKLLVASKTLLAEPIPNPPPEFALARFDPDGTPDGSFGVDGQGATDFGAVDFPNGVLVLPDGKIVLAGRSDADLLLARYNPDGTPDTAFGGGPMVRTEVGGLAWASALAAQADGKLIVTGSVMLQKPGTTPTLESLLARFNADGTPDLAFGGRGYLRASFGPGSTGGKDVVVQPDEKLVVSIRGDDFMGDDFTLVRFHGR